MIRLANACLLAALLASTAIPARAWDSPAPDVVLYCTPAMQAPLRDVASRYTAASGVEVHVLVGSPDGQAALIRHRARADVLVAEAPAIDSLAAEHLIRGGTIVALGADPFVLIGKAGAAIRPGAAIAQFIAAHAIVLPDPTSAASFDGPAVLHAALPDAVLPRIVGVADTPTVVALVGGDDALLGLVNRSEAGQPGIVQAASLAVPPVQIDGALLSNGQSRNAAALLAFIAGAQGRAILAGAGLEIAS